MKNDNHEGTWRSFFKYTLLAIAAITAAIKLMLTFLL